MTSKHSTQVLSRGFSFSFAGSGAVFPFISEKTEITAEDCYYSGTINEFENMQT